MSWQNHLKANVLSWLLEADPPEVRYLTLRYLLDRPADDPELGAARQAIYAGGHVAALLEKMDAEGFWAESGPGYLPKYRSTVWSIVTLAQLGASVEQDERIAHACAYMLDHALAEGGQFSASGTPAGTADCLQGNLCAALVDLGCADSCLSAAFEWMARSVTGEGVASVEDKHAPMRYYAGKCGPTFACGSNDKLPCAWGAVKVMLALSKCPVEYRTPLVERAIQHGVDFLLGVDPAEAAYPTGYSTKPSGNWWKFGFPVFYVTDLLQNVEALALLGYGGDPRLAHALNLIHEKQDDQGRWLLEYDYSGKVWTDFGAKKQPSKWVTLRALRVLKAADYIAVH